MFDATPGASRIHPNPLSTAIPMLRDSAMPGCPQEMPVTAFYSAAQKEGWEFAVFSCLHQLLGT